MRRALACVSLSLLVLGSAACGGDNATESPTAPSETNTLASGSPAARPTRTVTGSDASPSATVAAGTPAPTATTAPGQPTPAPSATKAPGGGQTAVPPTAVPPTAIPPTAPPACASGSSAVVGATAEYRWSNSGPRICAGGAVTWSWSGTAEPHNVVIPSLGFESQILTSDTVTRTFATPGLYAFNCAVHYQMTGRVTVE